MKVACNVHHEETKATKLAKAIVRRNPGEESGKSKVV